MIRSLRLRYFALMWVPVVLALSGVALSVSIWSAFEIRSIGRAERAAGEAGLQVNDGSAARRALVAAQRATVIAVVVAALVHGAISLLVPPPVVGRLRRLRDSARRLAAGEQDVHVPTACQDELGELEQSFDELSQALAASEQMKRQLMSDVSHELRTPLTNVIATLSAVQDGLRDADGATIESVHEEARLLKALIEDLQDLTMAESGTLVFARERVDLVGEASAALRACAARSREVVLDLVAAPSSIEVIADRKRVAQILRNLLDNALRHTPPGGRISVAISVGDSEAVVHVEDTGEGIPPEHLARIWERFHRVDPARARQTGGMGLGLALVRQFARGMGGDAHAVSQPGTGSTFMVRLPLARAVEYALGAERTHEHHRRGGHEQGVERYPA